MSASTGTPDEEALRAAKRPRSILAGPYGHPVHATAITVPIGAWTAALVFDIVALATRDPAFATGAFWLLVIGIAGAVVAAFFGLMDLTVIARGTPARRLAWAHLALNTAAVVLFAVSVLVRAGDPGRASVAGFVFAVVAFLVVGGSGFLGGELAYRFGIRVADEQTQRRGFTTARARRRADG